MQNGYVGVTLWFTGLPCSGKTTIAQHVKDALEASGDPVELLDGDELRRHFSAGVGFSKVDRSNHLKRVAYMCHLLSRQASRRVTSSGAMAANESSRPRS